MLGKALGRKLLFGPPRAHRRSRFSACVSQSGLRGKLVLHTLHVRAQASGKQAARRCSQAAAEATIRPLYLPLWKASTCQRRQGLAPTLSSPRHAPARNPVPLPPGVYPASARARKLAREN